MAGPVTTDGIKADSSAVGLTAQLVEVWDALIVVGHEMDDKDWRKPTPCPGWPVSAQYAHVIGTESMILGRPGPSGGEGERPDHVRNDIAAFNEVWVADLDHLDRSEVLERLAEVTAARRAELEAMTEADFSAPSWTPIGQADYRRFMQIRVFDCWVHDQDVRDALDRPGHQSGPCAEQSVDEIVRALGYLIGKKAGAPAGSSVQIRLSGPVVRDVDISVVDGRARVVASLAVEPTATLSMSSTAFTRLACGRVSSEHVLGGGLGGIKISGDAELAHRVADNLAFTI